LLKYFYHIRIAVFSVRKAVVLFGVPLSSHYDPGYDKY